MSLSDDVPVETVNKVITRKVQESVTNEPPPQKERKEDGESSLDSSGSDINWNPEDLIPEFRQTYQDEPGLQSRLEQELWIKVQLRREGRTLATFPLRFSYPNWHRDLKSDEDLIREEDIQII